MSQSEKIPGRWFLLYPLGYWLVTALTAYVLLLAVISLGDSAAFRVARQDMFFAGAKLDPLHEAGAGLGFWAVVFFCLNFILAARWRFVEAFFGGMDKAYKAHALAGKMGFYFVLLHMVILTVQAAPDLNLVLKYLVPGRDWGFSFGVLGTAAMVVLVTLTLWVKIPYSQWLSTHKLMIFPFLAGVSHAYILQQDWNMAVLGTLGTSAWVYSTFLWPAGKLRSGGTVERVEHKAGLHDVWIRPHRPFHAKPGQFVYFSVEDSGRIAGELHPFSVSGQDRGLLRLSIKALGDYTRSLSHLEAGQKVVLAGPYGRFGHRSLASPRPQVWIAGGIGITPFLSMLQTAGPQLLIWAVRDRDDAVFLQEIQALAQKNGGVRFVLHLSSESGRLNGEAVRSLAAQSGGPDVSYFLCGPDGMMKDLRKDLVRGGVSRLRIFDESFSLRS